MGVPAGYVSARFCKLVKEPNHFKATLLTALLFPGVCFAIFFFINLVAWSRQSSTAVPFGTLIVLMLLWFGVSLPLIFFGAFLGFKRETISLPVCVVYLVVCACRSCIIHLQILPPPTIWSKIVFFHVEQCYFLVDLNNLKMQMLATHV